ncbi:MAG TPA: VOC family protein [Phenylobacterium sp.]|nr:VOC family protein [Phenylobacterium sp.]
MPSLENLKKQAKQYLRWHREGRHPVAAQLRAALPKYAGLSDRQIMDQPFRLADAQALVARLEGFDSWQALKGSLQEMSAKTETVRYPARPVITTCEPQVFVTDMPRALAFYTATLGFTVGFVYGEPPFYAQVVRDGAMLNLRHVDRPAIDRAAGPDLLSVAFGVSHAKQLFQELQERGAPFRQTLTREPWHGQGQGNFIVEDPDGNLLLFGGRTD